MNDDVLQTFIEESTEYLDTLDISIVQLEENPSDKDLVKTIFRIMHSFKGACGMFGFHRLERVTHSAEDLMGMIRDGDLAVSSEIITTILSAIDVIRQISSHIRQHHTELAGDDTELLNALARMKQGQNPARASGKNSSGFHLFEDDPASPCAESVEKQDISLVNPVNPQQQPQSSQSVRVNIALLDELMNLVGELVLSRNQLLDAARNKDTGKGISSAIQHLNRVTSRLQETTMKTRMQPIGGSWTSFPRIIRDLQKVSGKKVELQMKGQDTEVDRQILQTLSDPLVHCIRNSVDHGIESPEARKAAGKNPTGMLSLNAYQEGGHIVLDISDDGAGLDIERIRAKAVERQIYTEEQAAKLSDMQVMRCIFEAGFSTASKVTELSGRGVGMDVVRSNVEKIGGSVDVISHKGRGTTIKIKIPLTLAIISGLIVNVGGDEGQDFAIPQASVLELQLVSKHKGTFDLIEDINGAKFYRLREQIIPLLNLGQILGVESKLQNEDCDEFYIVVTTFNGRLFGISVDSIRDTQEVVVKPAGKIAASINKYSGTTILGDGRVVLILDVVKIGEEIFRDSTGETERDEDEDEQTTQGDMARLLLVRGTDHKVVAIPLALVSRLEKFPKESIDVVNKRKSVQYRGRLLPLVPIRDADAGTEEAEFISSVIFLEGDRQFGLIVSEIEDIVDAELVVTPIGVEQGSLGVIIINDHATELLDVHYYTQKAQIPLPEKSRKKGPKTPRILLVEDSKFFIGLIKPFLESSGYIVEVSLNGKEALKKLEETEASFDLVLSDIEMPEMDGIALAVALKESRDFRHLPLIAITSMSEEGDRKRGLQAGFTEYLPKFDKEVLLSTLDKVLSENSFENDRTKESA